MEATTLIRLLDDLHAELRMCIENRIANVVAPIADPILLGDFIVDAYNDYLMTAKESFGNAAIQRLPEIEKLGDLDGDFEPLDGQKKGVGYHPRLHKMVEVSIASKRLKTLLEGGVEAKVERAGTAVDGAMMLLENLDEHVMRMIPLEAMGDREQVVARLVREYNRSLEAVVDATDDPVLSKMFQPLDVGDTAEHPHAKLTELKLTLGGLMRYLRQVLSKTPTTGHRSAKALNG